MEKKRLLLIAPIDLIAKLDSARRIDQRTSRSSAICKAIDDYSTKILDKRAENGKQ